ncbi:hypothetical protein DL96DRAFT_1815201 [Flagelloscypha sp. PMI_526]|nr:hypothetical protein DL96DRAFT_1815201 [Flagelloscypha sp. PMI_526]
MFSQLSTVVMAAIVATAFALPAVPGTTTYTCGSNQTLHCCDTTNNGGNPVANAVGGLVGLPINAAVPIGVTCPNVNVIGLLNDGSKCQQTVSCCDKNNQNGLVNVQCVPAGVQV